MTRISKTIKGDKLLWIAREGKTVVARSENKDKLDVLIEERAAARAVAKTKKVEKTTKEDGVKNDGRKTKKRSSKLRLKKSKK